MGSTGLWATIAFVIFFAMIFGFGLHTRLLSMLDARGERIRKELDHARELREEAQKILAQFESRRQEAEQEAKSIVEQAEAEAKQLAQEAKTKAEEFVARRTKMAELKIAQAEAQAIAEVRSVAADAAVDAAERVLKAQLKGKAATGFMEESIAEVKARIN